MKFHNESGRRAEKKERNFNHESGRGEGEEWCPRQAARRSVACGDRRSRTARPGLCRCRQRQFQLRAERAESCCCTCSHKSGNRAQGPSHRALSGSEAKERMKRGRAELSLGGDALAGALSTEFGKKISLIQCGAPPQQFEQRICHVLRLMVGGGIGRMLKLA